MKANTYLKIIIWHLNGFRKQSAIQKLPVQKLMLTIVWVFAIITGMV